MGTPVAAATAIGHQNWLAATGETARTRTVETIRELTAQGAQVARLARDGLNPEIGARLFLSAVQYQLGWVFAKLAMSSRRHLRYVLPTDPVTGRPR
jgi:DNA-binding CsgD family transcriptional regulator